MFHNVLITMKIHNHINFYMTFIIEKLENTEKQKRKQNYSYHQDCDKTIVTKTILTILHMQMHRIRPWLV